MALPGFRASCLTLAGLYVVLAGNILVRGSVLVMADYAVPPGTLASPHYADAMLWVFLHMTVIGLMIGVVGWFAEGVRMQRAFARLMLGALLVYTFLDVRSADWSLDAGRSARFRLWRSPRPLAPPPSSRVRAARAPAAVAGQWHWLVQTAAGKADNARYPTGNGQISLASRSR
jgi:hypothetical protein